MTTYKDIQRYVKSNFGYVPKSCWIAHMKEVCGLKPRKAYNRYDSGQRTNPCPKNKQQDIIDAFKHFGMISQTHYNTSQGCATSLISTLAVLSIVVVFLFLHH
jgi:hypothetical protein